MYLVFFFLHLLVVVFLANVDFFFEESIVITACGHAINKPFHLAFDEIKPI